MDRSFPPLGGVKGVAKPVDGDAAKKTLPAQNKGNENNENDANDGSPPKENSGTVNGKFIWTQTLSELNVTIPIPDNTRGRNLNVTLRKTHLKVGLKSRFPDYTVNAILVKLIICDDSI